MPVTTTRPLQAKRSVDSLFEGVVEASEDVLNGLGFDLQDATGGF